MADAAAKVGSDRDDPQRRCGIVFGSATTF